MTAHFIKISILPAEALSSAPASMQHFWTATAALSLCRASQAWDLKSTSCLVRSYTTKAEDKETRQSQLWRGISRGRQHYSDPDSDPRIQESDWRTTVARLGGRPTKPLTLRPAEWNRRSDATRNGTCGERVKRTRLLGVCNRGNRCLNLINFLSKSVVPIVFPISVCLCSYIHSYIATRSVTRVGVCQHANVCDALFSLFLAVAFRFGFGCGAWHTYIHTCFCIRIYVHIYDYTYRPYIMWLSVIAVLVTTAMPANRSICHQALIVNKYNLIVRIGLNTQGDDHSRQCRVLIIVRNYECITIFYYKYIAWNYNLYQKFAKQ